MHTHELKQSDMHPDPGALTHTHVHSKSREARVADRKRGAERKERTIHA